MLSKPSGLFLFKSKRIISVPPETLMCSQMNNRCSNPGEILKEQKYSSAS